MAAENHPPRRDYVHGVDLVRFFAAFSVAAFHLTWRNPETIRFLPWGWVGVEVFFVISGLVIVGSAQGKSAAQFGSSRLLRLYPAAWCALALNLVAIALSGPAVYNQVGVYTNADLANVVNSVTLIGSDFVVGSYWTLPVEIAFYGVILFVVAIGRFRNVEAVAKGLVLWSSPYILAFFVCTMLGRQGWMDLGYGLGNMSLLRHGPLFALGMFFWLLRDGRLGRSGIWFLLAAVALSAMEILCRAVEVAGRFAVPDDDPGIPAAELASGAMLVFAACCGGILLAVLRGSRWPRSVGWQRAVRWIGLTTYPYYLLHEAVGGGILYMFEEQLGLPTVPSVLAALACTGIMAFAVAALAEPWLRTRLRNAIEATAACLRRSATFRVLRGR